MPIEENDLAALTLLISPERLGSLNQLTGNVKDAIELHQETLKLGAALMNITAIIEIALRNAVCENLSAHFGVPNWLLNPPAPFTWKDAEKNKIKLAKDSAQRAEYSKLSQAEKHALDNHAFPNGVPPNTSHLTRAKKRRAFIQVTDGQVVAEITLYLWKRLHGPEYEHYLWRPTLRQMFPDRNVKRSDVADNLENIYQARNRLAHHEPVLHQRFADAVTSIKYIAMHLHSYPASQQTSLYRLITEDLTALEVQANALHNKLASFRNDGSNNENE